ncbi:MAG TPA: CehA/McbA family metallohydrolase [Kofleriaceae bacterium]|nr:CehA/McbA family metallohydrolase [Kofleriaceae bacterium]
MRRALLVLVACAGTDGPRRGPPAPVPQTAQAGPPAALAAPAPVAASAPTPDPEVWLRGTTHVHARPSGDSRTPIPDVIRWYESRGYDWIALTDHNRVSEAGGSTEGQPAVRFPAQGLIVLAGIELTYNPAKCLPKGHASGKCRIHVNLIGPTARPDGKVSWGLGQRLPDERLPKYQAALDLHRAFGGLAQVNHPQWFWGMTGDLLAELARRGVRLVEIANVQFEKWNRGDKDFPSTEALWDAALAAGVTLWGVASDDAHHYDGGGKWPAGGGWVVVKARRDPQAILDSLAAGRFYASTGVVLDRAEVSGGELVVEIAAADGRPHTIEFVENGVRVAPVKERVARRALPRTGYVRAVVTRDDGKRAWVQPVRP